MKVKYFISMGLLLLCNIVLAQIGIGTMEPTAELEIKGDIIFRGLKQVNTTEYYRRIVVDNDGNVGYLDKDPEGFFFNNVSFTYMPRQVGISQNREVDLNIGLDVDIPPRTKVLVIINYNIPVFIDYDRLNISMTTAGIELMKSENGKITPLVEGNRKFSFSMSYNYLEQGMFVEGVYVDEVENLTDNLSKVRYYLVGFTEAGNFEVLFSSNPDNLNETSMGVGNMSVKVFSKAF